MPSPSGCVIGILIFREEAVGDYLQCTQLLRIVLELWCGDERGRVIDVFVSDSKIIEEEEMIVELTIL